MEYRQLRIADKIYAWEGVRSHCHVRRLKVKLAKSLWEDGHDLNAISWIIHSKPVYTKQYIDDQSIDIGEDDIMLFVFGTLGVFILSVFIGFWFFPIGIILLFLIRWRCLD